MTILLERPDLVSALAPRRTASRYDGLLTGRPTDRHRVATRTPPAWRSSAPTPACRSPAAAGSPTPTSTTAHPRPALRVVKDTVDALLERYASVHRGAGWHSKICTELYEGAREPVRDFVGGRADDAVIFTRHTTDSFNLLAHCLPARTTVVVFETEHHAALLPWGRAAGRDTRSQTVVRLPAPRHDRPRPSRRSTTRCAAGRPAPRCW